MKLLDRITKWFFNTTKIEINTDWRLVALDLNQELIAATIFETKEEAIDYLKSASYEATGAYGNDWVYKDKTSSGVESRCRIWKVED